MLPSYLYALATLPLIRAAYVIEDDYEPSNFTSMFDFFTSPDPTNGYVSYVDQTTALNDGLFALRGNTVFMGVDSTNIASGSGRNSIRLTSTKAYTHGLVILDLAHMPGGECGTWPAFWMTGPDWPTNGELDIIEGVNSATTNAMTLHTDAGCSIANNGSFSGKLITSNCDVNAIGQTTNEGCSIDTTNTASFGAGFNAGGGGIYATEWTSSVINIWYFPRDAISSDITNGNPDPSGWGLPMSSFSGACDLDEHVDNMQIVFDTTFCGDWAGNAWSSDPICSPKASTCQDFVQNNPSAFVDAYWSVNSLKVYQDNGLANSAATTSRTLSSTTSAAISSQTTNAITTASTTSETVIYVTVTVNPPSTPSTPMIPTQSSTSYQSSTTTYQPSTTIYQFSTTAHQPSTTIYQPSTTAYEFSTTTTSTSTSTTSQSFTIFTSSNSPTPAASTLLTTFSTTISASATSTSSSSGTTESLTSSATASFNNPFGFPFSNPFGFPGGPFRFGPPPRRSVFTT